jgi:patatin-related protein
MSTRDANGPAVESADVRELRLAVVLYGGVSLAIYMHGTTKELNRLVKASTLEELRLETDETPSETFWREFLRELAERDPKGVRTRIVVDIVAGTSAGGINGIYLAKALARNESQDALRDLWLDHGDIAQLLRGPSWMPPVLKAPWLLAATLRKPPLRGDTIAQWMFHALRDMDDLGAQPPDLPTLMPDRHLLELFVTTTDFQGYDRDLLLADPALIHDHAHRHVLVFRFGDGDDAFRREDNAALAFSARVTSCFPGAFPPVSFDEFERYLEKDGADLSGLGSGFFRIYELSNAEPRNTFFVDGGILDNRPFGHAIAAIKRRPAQSEVRRKLLYLEPDPGGRGPRPTGGDAPRPVATVLAAVSGIPRKEPLLDDIQAVSRLNERVRRIQEVIVMSWEPIAQRVADVVGKDLSGLAEHPSAEEIDRWRQRLNDEAEQAAGFAWATYLRSKVSSVVDRYARTICRLSDYPEDCNQAVFVRQVLRLWAEGRLFAERNGRPAPAEDQVAFLRTFDLEYGARRLRFVIDALSWWYRHCDEEGYPSREQLNEGKRRLYQAQGVLVDAMDGKGLATDLTDEVLACFGQVSVDDWIYKQKRSAQDYVDTHEEPLARLEQEFGKSLNDALEGFGEQLAGSVFEVAEGWAPARREDLLVRFLGFPIWDSLLYPIQSTADVGERDSVDIVRMSPRDARLLKPLDPKNPKLSGVGVMHFGAFFSRDGRENDYLWGRLDGAERLIGILLGPDASAEDKAAWTKKAFGAIVAEEEQALPRARALVEHARSFSGQASVPA